MKRQNLINRLVARKINSGKTRAFCVCMARALCYVAGQRRTPAGTKN